MRKRPRSTQTRSVKTEPGSPEPRADPRLARVAAAFKSDRTVTSGGKGFGSTGLKVGGKLFAFISSKGQFVVKVPRARAADLIAAGNAVAFDPGHGRVMKEWIAVRSSSRSWLALAKEAREYVGTQPRK